MVCWSASCVFQRFALQVLAQKDYLILPSETPVLVHGIGDMNDVDFEREPKHIGKT